ncbi:DUF1819 family protein [Laribacter hongkongensis]|uniref:DUF1819 family protein n=1 Tax=Laribacter hongkongensis TaxID=168471 RepID=UPI001EFE5772|nr:DUF1819 family protein [Laribacter hongkongensis]MCG9000256.1 DUF1819 family protein [Laribacter hongkongensis]MCG9006646.1 DUF1819 family protein [Laribacter hongkongensis]MCG9015684.1 DUF1819 family protein [Laribacter hongkongensis]
MNYSAQLSAGSLLVPESRQLASLLLQHPDEAAWQHAIKVDNVLQKASPATAWRMARLIRQRLECLDEAGLAMVANDSLEVATQMLLLAAVRHSRLLGDYMIDVYRGRLRRLETHLNPKDWAVFVHECEQRDPSVREWTTSTRAKLLQVILRILAEAGYLDSTRSLRMTPPLLHPRVRAYLVASKDHYAREAMELRT